MRALLVTATETEFEMTMFEDIPEVQMMEKTIDQLKRKLSAYRDVLLMLSKQEIGTWYSTAGEAGYWAGWDDGEYAIKKVLEEEKL